MGDHLILYVDRLITSSTFEGSNEIGPPLAPGTNNEGTGMQGEASANTSSGSALQFDGESEGGVPVLKPAECRICQEEDEEDSMEAPCACSGSLKFAHRKCVQRWCNEKCSITCEICHQPYTPGYTAPSPPPHSDDSPIDISGNWPGTQLGFHDPRLLAMAAAERHFLEAEYDEYAAANASGAAFCRSAALILMALLLLRHALNITNAEGDEDSTTVFSLFLLRAAGFLLPCYIMAWAISILQRRRQRQEAAMAATEVALLLEVGHARGLQHGTPGPPSGHELP
uniref:TSA: Wollemia nobilis Ref_Wollemi_Transcript_14989_1646 transcribed RNA sequence n=1 Tax=Wollemia nobilis TaxID=56998 RepID=A0A0C9QPC6_9CONI